MLSDWIGKRKEEMWIDKNCSRFHFNWLRMSARHPRISQAQLTMREMENSTNECIVRAHESQTDLLRAEVSGEEIEFSLLLVHAQDHLMTTITFGRLAEEFVRLYREVHRG